ncbi:hypothetical protein ACWFOS_17115 [Gordonia terrae]
MTKLWRNHELFGRRGVLQAGLRNEYTISDVEKVIAGDTDAADVPLD